MTWDLAHMSRAARSKPVGRPTTECRATPSKASNTVMRSDNCENSVSSLAQLRQWSFSEEDTFAQSSASITDWNANEAASFLFRSTVREFRSDSATGVSRWLPGTILATARQATSSLAQDTRPSCARRAPGWRRYASTLLRAIASSLAESKSAALARTARSHRVESKESDRFNM